MAEEGPRKAPPGAAPGEDLGRNRPTNQMPFVGPPVPSSLNQVNHSNVQSNNGVVNPQTQGMAPPLAAAGPPVQAPPFANFNPTTGVVGNINLNALNNPMAWSGMKNVRDPDIDAVLNESWNTQLVLVGWSPHRKPVMNLENDVFVRSLTEDPWRHSGNVVFFCDGKKIVRCHGILLQSILPEFYEELLHMANFQYNPSCRSPELPYIPICVTGVDQRCIEHFLSLIFRGIAVMTGKEVQQLLQVLENLRIHELVVCIAPTPGNNGNPEWLNTAGATTTTTAAQPSSPNSIAMSSTASVPPPFISFQQDVKSNNPMDNSEPGNRQPMTVNTQGDVNKLEPAPFQSIGVHSTGLLADETYGFGQASLRPNRKNYTLTNNSGSTSSASGDEQMKTVKTVVIKQSSRPRRTSNRIQKAIVKTESTAPPPPMKTPPKGSSSQSPPILGNVSFGLTPSSSSLPGARSSPVDDESPNPVVKRRRRTRAKSEKVLEKKTPRRVSECRGSPSDGDDEDETDRKKRKRTVYPKEMRGKALDALNEGKQVRDVACELNVPSKLISRWKYEAKKAETEDITVPAVTINDDDPPFEPNATTVSNIVNKNSLSFDFGGENNDNITNPYMKIKSEPMVEYYGGNTADLVAFSESHPEMSMHPMNIFNIDKQQNLSIEDTQNQDETGQ
ncbi:hypothetical protein Ocin01_17336 [Orchesella cincta]|uniref:BTB domain-containing protein n=1 Tax=Orchesella cincta TaxID=48709 RepID=A0A1D2M8N4_ORCCI|nr:hypothetical protein Ocin01_17336 [Orchesella cincta]